MNKGDLSNCFSGETGSVHVRSRSIERETLLASSDANDGETVLGGRRAIGVSGKRGALGASDNKAAKDAAINEAMSAIEREMRRDLADLYAAYGDLSKTLTDIAKAQTRLQGWQDALADGDLPALDENGEIVDDEFEALVAAYEAKNGVSVDRTDAAMLASIIAAEQARQADRYIAVKGKRDQVEAKMDDLEAKLDVGQEERDLARQPSDNTTDREAIFINTKDVAQSDNQAAAPLSDAYKL